MSTEADAIVKAAAQAARTSQLLGAGFVPVKGTAKLDGSRAGAQVEPKPKPKAKSRSAKLDTRDRAAVEAQMAALRARYEADAPHEKFVTDHTQIVWGDGDVLAELMFIGEAPGAEEDKQGIPFVGRSGQLLNKMIEAIGLTRERVYIANVLKTRPPNNATPTVEEAELCAPYLFEQIAIVNPKAIVTLGKPAAQLLLQTTESMGRLRGAWHEIEIPVGPLETRAVPVMPTYHPAYVLRNYTPETRGKVWSDLKLAAERIGV